MPFKQGDGLYYTDLVNTATKFKIREVITAVEKNRSCVYQVVKIEGRRVWMRLVESASMKGKHG